MQPIEVRPDNKFAVESFCDNCLSGVVECALHLRFAAIHS